METLTFEINKTNISLVSTTFQAPYLTGKNTDYQCVFTWSSEWDNLTKKATFHNTQSGMKKAMLLDSDSCLIPYDVLTYGNLEIGLGGYDNETLIKNSRLYIMAVQRSAGDNDENMESVDPSLVDQLFAEIADCRRALDYTETASEKAEEASGSAAEALECVQLASQHKDSAETAQGLAEAAQADAEEAQGKAEDAQAAAETAQGLAEAAARAAQQVAEAMDSETIYASIGSKGDNLFFNEEDGKLYLTSDGEIIGDGVVVVTSGGGGGGGGGYAEYRLSLLNLLPDRMFSVSDTATVELQFSYSSEDSDHYDDGAGIGQIIVNNIVKRTFSVPQGNNTIDVTDYLSAGANTVNVKVTNSEGNSKTLTYQISVVSLRVSTTFDEMATYNGNVEFTYTPSGVGEKTIHFVMDGTELDTATVVSNNRSQTFTIPEQGHGAHIFECYATMTVDEIDVTSNVITLGMMWIDPVSHEPIILCPFSVTTARQGETLTIPYMVYDPDTETATVHRQILDEDNLVYSTSEITVDRTAQSWSVADYPSGSISIVLTCGSVSITKTITVSASTLYIEPITDALQLEFSAAGRSNNEQNPESWSYGSGVNAIVATFDGFGWSGADGWVDDANGNTVLRFLPNDFMTIPFEAFATDARTSGLTIEAEFATRDVQDYDSVVISSFANGRGFKIASQNAELRSEQSSVSMQFKEDSRVRVCFAVENRNKNRLVYIYINGVMCGVSQYPVNDDFSQPEPVGLSIGAESCGLDLYKIRIYGKGLTKDEQLDNFIYDRPTLAQREAAYRRNDVLNQSEEVDITKLPPTLPYMIFECAELPQYKGDKKTGINVTYVDPANANNSFTATGVEMDVQGTSSAGYPVKNFKPKFKNGFVMTATGETESKYKLRSTSLPVSTFCLKADFASSENANNVKLVDFYEQTCPYKTPPQQEDDRVRQGIDGIPIVVFWQDLSGNVQFIGKYNFNNDKSTANVFGFTDDYPNAESWEFRNNTSNRCLLKTSDYSDDSWLNDFEARYPEDSTDFTQLKRVTDWLASTDRDAVLSAEDKAARLAKFTSEFEDYFIKSATLFYYLFTEVFLMIDSRAKNMFLTTYDGVHWLPIPYDFDTAIGINNEGVLSFDYDLEDTDTVGGANVFNGQTSVLWCNVRDAFGSDLKEMYKTLRSGNTFKFDTIKAMFDEHQSVWPEAIWNEDAFVKYLQPYLIDNENYLSMLQGSKESQRDWWLYNAFKYRDSKYQAGDALSNFITLRCYALGDITVTPYSHIHPTIKYGSYTITTRGKRNTAYTMTNPMDQMNDTEVYIYSADRIKDVGDLSGLQVGYANFAAATKLQALKLGDSDSNYENTNLKELYVGNNELLQTVDLRNCSALGTDTQKTVDFSGCTSLGKVYAQGTALGGITLPNGGHIEELHYPSTLTNLTILNQKNLSALTYEGLTELTTLHIENTPNVDVESVVDDATALNRVRLIGINWTATSSSTLEDTIEKLAGCIGMDAAGNNTGKAIVTGTVDVPSITLEQYEAIRAEFPELNITAAGKALYVVTFKNGSTVYDRQLVAHGDDATAPQTDPTFAPTAQYTYTFSGWNPAYTNITSNKTINAQYTSTVRTYTVRFYNGETLLQTINGVPYGGTATYTGETPVDPTGKERNFDHWKPSNVGIIGETNCVAKYEVIYRNVEITDSWEDIIASIEDGTYDTKYQVGNHKTIDISHFTYQNVSCVATSIDVEIAAFDEDILSDGSGFAPITFICRHTYASSQAHLLQHGKQGWCDSDARTFFNNNVRSAMPNTIKNNIVSVKKYTSHINNNNIETDDYLWLPSVYEVFGDSVEQQQETIGVSYADSIYTTSSRLIRLNVSSNSATSSRLRTIATVTSTSTSGTQTRIRDYTINSNGQLSYNNRTSVAIVPSIGAFGFCLGTSAQVAAQGE